MLGSGSGYGSRRTRLRAVRMSGLALVLLAGLALHGRDLETVRVAYYLVVVAVLGLAGWRRRGQLSLRHPTEPPEGPAAGPGSL